MNFSDEAEARRVALVYECVPKDWNSEWKGSAQVVARLAKGLLDKTKDQWVELGLRGEEIVALHILQFHPERGGWAMIRSLWVHPELRGQGIGKRLKLAGENWAREKGAKSIVTQVYIANERMNAINRAMGFTPSKIEYEKKLNT